MSQFFVSVLASVVVALLCEVWHFAWLRRHDHEALRELLRDALREHHSVSVEVDGEHWNIE